MTIYRDKKRNNNWYCRFSINGERHNFKCKGATDKKTAEELEAMYIVEVQKQQNGIKPKKQEIVKFNKVADMYLEYSKLNNKGFDKEKCRIEKLKKYFNNKDIAKIKPADIEYLKTTLVNKGLCRTTANRYLELLSVIFNRAIENGLMKESPIKKHTKFQIKNYTTRYLTDEEEQALLKVMPDYFVPIFKFALGTGLRKANILELKWSQLNFDTREIEILENKGNKHIILPMTDILFEILSNLPKLNDEYVFVNPNTNDIYSEPVFRRLWNDIKEKAGVENLRFHDLRHTVGTRLANAGVPVPVIKEILAHSDIRTTQRYMHTNSKIIKDSLNLI